MVRQSAMGIALLAFVVLMGNQLTSQGDERERENRERRERAESSEEREERRGLRFRDFEREEEEDIDGLNWDMEEEISEEQIQLLAWIGVETGPLSPEVRAHVPVEEDQGHMVYEVIAGSPAAKAGLKEFDILLTVNSEVLKDFDQFVQLVQKAKENPLAIGILRKGAKMELSLVPGKRPWNFDVFMPGSVTVPDDVEITITKKGSEPVRLTIRQKEETWAAASEEEFEQLPEKVISWLFATVEEIMPFEEEEEDILFWDLDQRRDEDGEERDERDRGRRRERDRDEDEERERDFERERDEDGDEDGEREREREDVEFEDEDREIERDDDEGEERERDGEESQDEESDDEENFDEEEGREVDEELDATIR